MIVQELRGRRGGASCNAAACYVRVRVRRACAMCVCDARGGYRCAVPHVPLARYRAWRSRTARDDQIRGSRKEVG